MGREYSVKLAAAKVAGKRSSLGEVRGRAPAQLGDIAVPSARPREIPSDRDRGQPPKSRFGCQAAISSIRASTAFFFTETMPFSIAAAELYISLLPITSPFFALRTK